VLFLAALRQVASNKFGTPHLVTEVIARDEQTDSQTGKNYKRHGVSPVILFYYQLIGVTAICLSRARFTLSIKSLGTQVSLWVLLG